MADEDDIEPEESEEEAATGDDVDASEPAREKSKETAPAPMPGGSELVTLKIRRQDEGARPESKRWEEFEVPRSPGMTVVTALNAIRRAPKNKAGTDVAPVAFEATCLEEVCGGCTMLVNGKPRLACATLIDEVSPKAQAVVLQPLSSFLLVRDLVVDRSRMQESLRKVEAWVAIDAASSDEPTRQSQTDQRVAYERSQCIDCGACLEACPQFGPHSDFIGAAALNEVERLGRHPVGGLSNGRRLDAAMGPGGISGCGKAQNCVEVCPRKIPLTESIAAVGRSATRRLLKDWIFG